MALAKTWEEWKARQPKDVFKIPTGPITMTSIKPFDDEIPEGYEEYTGEVLPASEGYEEYTGPVLSAPPDGYDGREFDDSLMGRAKRYGMLAQRAVQESTPPSTGIMAADVIRKPLGQLNYIAKAAEEAGLAAVTGVAGFIGGGLAGGLRTGYGLATGENLEEATAAGREALEGVERGITYSPRTAGGKLATELLSEPIRLSEAIGRKVGGYTGKPFGPKAEIAGEEIGGALGVAAPAIAPLVKGRFLKKAREPVPELPPTPKQAAAIEGQKLGYVLPPSEARPGLLNRLITGWGGKIKTQQAASMKNQNVTNNLAKRALGLPDEKITDAAINHAIASREGGGAYAAVENSGVPIKADPMTPHGKAYIEKINKLGDSWKSAAKDYPELAAQEAAIGDLQNMMLKPEVSAAGAVEMVKYLRKKASANSRAFYDAGKLALGRAQRHAAFALDDLIKGNMEEAGKGQLATDYIHAREYIAKAYDVKAALNDANGNVDGAFLGRLLKKNKNLTGELKAAAEFANQHDRLVQRPERIGTYTEFSPLDVAVAGIEAAPPLAAGRPDVAAGLVGTVLGRPLARQFGLSDFYQRHGARARPSLDIKARNAAQLRKARAAGYVAAAEGITAIPPEEEEEEMREFP